MRKGLQILFITILVLIIGYFAYNQFRIRSISSDYQILPEFTLNDVNGAKFNSSQISRDKQKLLIYFDSECEHCLEEATAISKHIDSFKNIQLLFISYQEPEAITEFAETYHFLSLPNAVFLEDKYLQLVSAFNIKEFPFMLLYSKDNKLIQKFEGPTDVEILLKSINKI